MTPKIAVLVLANRTGTAPNYIYSIDDYTTKDFGETENWRKDLSQRIK